MLQGIREKNGFERERAELKHVLSSPQFSRAPALSRILSFLCEKYFDGQTESIKEYTIAVEALGRSDGFDPATDTIVRVEASRLRRRLQRYYEAEGAEHEVQILLPDSGYVPQFIQRSRRAKPAQQTPDGLPLARPGDGKMSGRHVRKAFVALSALALVLAVASYVSFRLALPHGTNHSASQPIVASGSDDTIRILAGHAESNVIDSIGRTWSNDRYFNGGTAVERVFRRVYRTRSQNLYRSARQGDFRYDIPLKPGLYELHLHFVEIIPEELDLESGGEQTSRFNVFLNDKPLLSFFDVVADAGGPNIADERVFTDVSPAADGFLHLRFASSVNRAHVTAIEILPGVPGKMRSVRLVAALDSSYDSRGTLWEADRYFLGGRITHRGASVNNTPDPMLYHSERWGHFSYAIPVAPGLYRLTLRFAETYPGGITPGNRLFDVYCNGTTLLKKFDVVVEAGGANRVADQVFRNISPNAQGKLLLSFVPVRNYSIINAIEVVAED